mmetsp:Transcript_15528/g.23675  ORF Transcript_15528/g.23675 Transcript_15528/m.23675 type:complete len:239 (+) Transcript_15528:91-807(+)|eukprot:CAMPEP_0118700424 /NCGR_PEP_ID=MMETSP0800-20121206/16569_1 /TAXON_ID=210618 ORGANISM="Striatella unipunctata, Strain CCMP2910" /NCGR_SAMPLE_ID=MMETSP0800 /ASSEMBLY_ACC=CAM_ASM_000638 /LENGTH=238 /DNA_ID=CAMNT_0006600995 /DNA_START=72 /DNA_END=788 /DNA_ORIENTATION=+
MSAEQDAAIMESVAISNEGEFNPGAELKADADIDPTKTPEDPWADDILGDLGDLDIGGGATAAGANSDPTMQGDDDPTVEKIKETSAKLGTAIKDVTSDFVGFTTGTLKDLSRGVMEVDQKHDLSKNVGNTVMAATAAIGSFWQSVDQTWDLSGKGKVVGSTVQENVVKPLKQMDEQHGISAKTAEALAAGARFVSEALENNNEEGGEGNNNNNEGTTTTASSTTNVNLDAIDQNKDD